VPELVQPTAHRYAAWHDARADWGPGVHEDGFGLLPGDDVGTPAGFRAWVDRLRQQSAPAQGSATYWWVAEGDAVVGAIALRRELDDVSLRLGQVGYGVRPSARRRGLATWALGEVLAVARADGLDRVLIACAEDNTASARVVEHHGGRLAEVSATATGPVRRYQVPLSPGS